MPKTIILDNLKLEKQIANIEQVAKKNKWVYQYDPELDYLYYTPKKIPAGYVLHSLNEDINVYVNTQSKLGGIFIEYFKYNMTAHEEKYKEFAEIFTKDTKHGKTNPKSYENKVRVLSEILKADMLSDLIRTDKQCVEIPA